MTVRFFLFIWLILLLSGCAAHRASPQETVLFPDAAKEKWWIINAISKDEKGGDVHVCSLLRFIPSGEKYFTHFFTSIWMEFDSIYYAGVQSSEEPSFQKKLKFPIKLTSTSEDSTALPWYWRLNRNGMRLQSVVTDAAIKQPLRLKMNFRRKNDADFDPIEVKGDINTQNLAPAAWDMHVSGDWNFSSPALVNFHIIESGERLLERTKRSFISWLDLSLDHETHISLLMQTSLNGDIKVLNQSCWRKEQLSDITVRLTANVEKNKANHSAYPLYLSLELPEINKTFQIVPRMERQEISLHKSAFWMGAVQISDPLTGIVSGKGNLYVLKQ